MRTGRIIALVIGTLLALPAVALLGSGAALAVAYGTQRDGGYFDLALDRMETETAAITAEQIDLRTDPGTPDWVVDALDTDVRLRVTGADADRPLFVGIAPEADLDPYLAGVAHDEVRNVDDRQVELRPRSGDEAAAPPTDQDFWEASATGTGTVELEWTARSGQWAVALMNADGSPGVAVDVDVGVRSDIFLPVAIALLATGAVLAVAAAGAIIFGGLGLGAESPQPTGQPPMAGTGEAGIHPPVDSTLDSAPYPLVLEAELDPGLSRWQWLVKWFLAIPHLIVLALLWVAFVVLTAVAGVAILFTGRYPQALFGFNVGVLRWSWRVSYYAFSGGLGTDRYPPFSLGPEPHYPATLDVEYPEHLNRWLVLVKWWLLALPHYLIVGVIAGGGFRWETDAGWSAGWGPVGGGLVGILTFVAAVVLLVTGRYPRTLHDLIVGLNRWVYRVTAYVALMTDRYPPFRLDQGGAESSPPVPPPPSSPPESVAVEPEPPVDERDTDRAQPAPSM